MSARLRHLVMITAAVVALSGCSFSASYSTRWYTGKPDRVKVSGPPPDAPAEEAKECKGAKVWVYGYWGYEESKWVWTKGACKKPPEAGAEWVGPVLYETDDGYELVPGHWAPPRSSGGERAVKDDKPSGGRSVGVSIGTGGKKPSGGGNAAADQADDAAEDAQAAAEEAKDAAEDAQEAADEAKDAAEEAKDEAKNEAKDEAAAGGAAAGGAVTTPARPDRSAQEGMRELDELECKLGSETVQPGKKLALTVEGLKEAPKVAFDKLGVRIVRFREDTVVVRVPRTMPRAAKVWVLYRGSRIDCGKVTPEGLAPVRPDTLREGSAAKAETKPAAKKEAAASTRAGADRDLEKK